MTAPGSIEGRRISRPSPGIEPDLRRHHAAKPTSLARRAVGALAAVAITASVTFAQATLPSVAAYVARLEPVLGPPAASALARIDGDGRKLLAARSYLRAGASLAERWSWSDEQIERYQRSEEASAAMAEVEQVRSRFAERNPGYQLYVKTKVRSLDAQIAAWNRNASVGAASEALLRAAADEIARETSRSTARPDAAALERFAGWLKTWAPEVAPTLAAPGLSAHGRSRAFDFQVRQGARTVAATDASQIATVWDGEGWTERLAAAVAASEHLRGPLESPREPWHYDYVP